MLLIMMWLPVETDERLQSGQGEGSQARMWIVKGVSKVEWEESEKFWCPGFFSENVISELIPIVS